MDGRTVEAYSPEWYKVRVARFTASRLYDLISKPKDKTLPKPYIIEKVAESLTGESQDSGYFDENMAHGVEYEPLAIKWFSKTSGFKVEENSEFIMHPDLNFGATPDRIAYDSNGNKFILEVKCPKSTTHIKNCLLKDVEDFKSKHPKYYWQIIGGAIVTDATHGCFISFDPRIDSNAGLFVLPFELPVEDMDTAKDVIADASKQMDELIKKLQ